MATESTQLAVWNPQSMVSLDTIPMPATPEQMKPYIYSFDQGGQTVTDLNADFWKVCGDNLGISITEVEFTDLSDTMIECKATSQWKDRTEVGIVRHIRRSPKDVHAYSAASTRARRNAIKAFLPVQAMRDRMYEIMGIAATDNSGGGGNGGNGGGSSPRGASDKQKALLRDLGEPEESINAYTSKQASDRIGALLEQKKNPPQEEEAPPQTENDIPF